MCSMTAYYRTEGNKALANNAFVSVDLFYKDCLTDLLTTSVNYEGRSSFHGASGDDCTSE